MQTIIPITDLTLKEGDKKIFKVQLIKDQMPFVLSPTAIVKLIIGKNDNVYINKKIMVANAEQGIVEFSITTNIGTGLFDCEFIVIDGEVETTFPDLLPAALYIAKDVENGTDTEVTPELYDVLTEQIRDVEIETQRVIVEQNELQDALEQITQQIEELDETTLTEDEVNELVDRKANLNHVHVIEDVNGLKEQLDNKALKNHVHNQYITEHQSLDHLATIDHTHNEFNELNDKLEAKANINHTHDTFKTLQDQLDKKAAKTHNHQISEVNGLSAKLNILAEADHTHTIDKIEGLQNVLDTKVDGEHKHKIADVNNLQEELNKKSNINHTHAIFTTFKNDIDAKAPKKHTHTMAEVSGLATKLNTLTDADIKLTNDLQAIEDAMASINANTNNKINTINNELKTSITNTNNKLNTVNSNLKASIADTDKKLTKEIATKVSVSSFSSHLAQQQATDYKQDKEIATLDETLTDLREEVANIQLSGVTGEIEVLTTEEIETMWKNINDK